MLKTRPNGHLIPAMSGYFLKSMFLASHGGEDGIRTRGAVEDSSAYKAATINHSVTSP